MFLMKTQVARESGVTQNDDNNTFAAALLSCPISHMCLFTTIYFTNQCYYNKHSLLRFHCFNTFNVAPSPGIALVSVCEPSGPRCAANRWRTPSPRCRWSPGRRWEVRPQRPLQRRAADQRSSPQQMIIRFLAPAVLWPVYAHQDCDPQPDLP